ncbi:hypothetical protein D3C73_1369140 [compost metagenome]
MKFSHDAVVYLSLYSIMDSAVDIRVTKFKLSALSVNLTVASSNSLSILSTSV